MLHGAAAHINPAKSLDCHLDTPWPRAGQRSTAGHTESAPHRYDVGVEIGQLVFVAAVLGVLAAIRRIDVPPAVERHAMSMATYGIGTMAAFWFIERLAGFAI